MHLAFLAVGLLQTRACSSTAPILPSVFLYHFAHSAHTEHVMAIRILHADGRWPWGGKATAQGYMCVGCLQYHTCIRLFCNTGSMESSSQHGVEHTP